MELSLYYQVKNLVFKRICRGFKPSCKLPVENLVVAVEETADRTSL
ncbi:hypothetical protein OAG79_02180 [Akkermansiaceae bacterium]|nr:hypothetical protein [Akkermansiaceae bacterium]MDB4620077.1 hypothetical protein [Akkermansiaceae bacterium]